MILIAYSLILKTDIRIECKVFIFLFGLVCGLSFITGFYGDWKMHESIKSVKNSSDDAVNWLNDIKSFVENASKVMDVEIDINKINSDIDVIVVEIRQKPPPFPVDTIINEITGYKQQSLQISTELNKAKQQLVDANKTLGEYPYNKVPQLIDEFGNIFFITTACVLSVLAIVGLVFMCAICSRCVLGCFTLLAVISLIVSSLVLAVSLSGSVGVSDFCYDSEPWFKSMITNKDIYEYLFVCTKSNTLINTYTDQAKAALKEAQTQFSQVSNVKTILNSQLCGHPDYYPCTQNTNDSITSIVNSLNNIDSKIVSANSLINSFIEISDCKRIKGNLDETLGSICTDFIKGLSFIFFNTIASSICFALLVISATFALR